MKKKASCQNRKTLIDFIIYTKLLHLQFECKVSLSIMYTQTNYFLLGII